jgi:hypothetical protein
MLAPTPSPRMITHPQSRPLRESLLLGLVVIGMMIVGAVFLYFVAEGLLWLESAISSCTRGRSAAKLIAAACGELAKLPERVSSVHRRLTRLAPGGGG